MKIIIADELPLFRDSLARIVCRIIPNIEVIKVNSFDQLEEQLQAHSDIAMVFMDLHVPGNSGLSAIALLQTDFPKVKLVIVSATESPMIVYRTIKLGGRGFIPKAANQKTFSQAVSAIHTGKIWIPKELKPRELDSHSHSVVPVKTCDKNECLSEKIASLSPRQFKVLSMISDGKLNKQIAYMLELREGTVKHHVSLILQKLNVINRTAASNMFNRLKVEKRLSR
ncbi:MAG: response regulator transcription factor [Kangiellaceae bacterium]|nr:response regulator transcription factor [Kangiellaceae bacterium]